MLKQLWRTTNSSVRYKLLILVLIPILAILPLILGFTLYWFYKFTYKQLYAKVGSDLAVANDVFARLQNDYLNKLEKLVESHSFQLAYAGNDQDRINDQLELMLKTTDFDYLRVVKRDRISDSQPSSPILENAMRLAKPGVGVQVFFRDALKASNPQIADKVVLPLINTPFSAPTSRTVENRALVVRAAYPIRNQFGDTTAVLDGGVLLNRNFSFVDDIRDLVYGEGSLPEGGWGTVTVLLDDVRISTNVPLREGERALGTRVSKEVRDHVLGDGREWIDRAFVVNDWYISAYKPILDVFGDRVGMLYTGYLESPFTRAYVGTVTILIALIVLTGFTIGLIVVLGAKSIFHPIELMTDVVRATQRGEDRRIGAVSSHDEIGELANQFDSMLDLLKERSQEIEKATDKLEQEVEARTQELKSKNTWLEETVNLLRSTQQQLTAAAKLAALGQLTAGVAHEINNPTAVILGNIDILTKELGDDAKSVETEVNLIIEQVYRIRSIVDKLLQYARPAESSGYIDKVDVNELVKMTLQLVEHEISLKSVSLNICLRATNKVRISPQELQQVLVNLFMNAVQALPKKGVIDCSTDDSSEGVTITIRDNGSGIAPVDLARVFDPFYTRKSEGTGLGLSVSFSLIQRYGGNIKVESKEGEWTEFTINLRKNPLTKETERLLRSYA
ncbi:MAG: cache domain-containing protein [Arenicellales bacterium]|nr:cache domain-containing protein [Arenicellales bacterium]